MLCILAFFSLGDVWYPKGCCISTRYHPLNIPWKDGGVYIVKVWCMWFIRMCGLSCTFPTSPVKLFVSPSSNLFWMFVLGMWGASIVFGGWKSHSNDSRFRGSYSHSDCAKLNLNGSAFFQQHKWVDGLQWAEVFIWAVFSNVYIYIYYYIFMLISILYKYTYM